MARDPICGMSVDESNAEYKKEHKGQTYFFCSDDCMAQFEAEPDEHAAPKDDGTKQFGLGR